MIHDLYHARAPSFIALSPWPPRYLIRSAELQLQPTLPRIIEPSSRTSSLLSWNLALSHKNKSSMIFKAKRLVLIWVWILFSIWCSVALRVSTVQVGSSWTMVLELPPSERKHFQIAVEVGSVTMNFTPDFSEVRGNFRGKLARIQMSWQLLASPTQLPGREQ